MKELIILGCGPTRVDCPYERNIPVWTVNAGWHFANRIDRLFVFDDFGKGEFQWENVLEVLKKAPYPIVHKKPLDGWNNIVVYPLDEISGRFKSKYFTNAICYMIAMALYEGYEKLYIYGVDHLIHQGYVMEKGGVEHWIGIAKGMGVDVEVASGSALCKTVSGKCYGYDFFYDGSWERPEEIIVARAI